jgi:cytidylate kinase
MTAKQLGVKLAELPPEIHWSIDADTLMFANEKNRLKVIEGRFLRYVLANSVEPTFVIELAASNNARCLRWETRTGKPFMKEDLLRLDEEDRIFCRSMYAEVVAIESSVCLDTSDLSVEECQEIVLNAIRSCTCVRCD